MLNKATYVDRNLLIIHFPDCSNQIDQTARNIRIIRHHIKIIRCYISNICHHLQPLSSLSCCYLITKPSKFNLGSGAGAQDWQIGPSTHSQYHKLGRSPYRDLRPFCQVLLSIKLRFEF